MGEKSKEPTPRAKRRQHLAKLLEWWDAEVGARPANLEDILGGLLGEVAYENMMRALKGARAKQQRPEDVLELARDDLRTYQRLRKRAAARGPRKPDR